MLNLATSSGDVAVSNQLNIPSLRKNLRWPVNTLRTSKYLVCPFWATVETRQCNMTDCGKGPAPSVDDEGSPKVKIKTKQHKVSCFQVFIN